KKGWERERWFEAKSEINALSNIMTEERQKLMDELEISDDTVRKRMRRGWTFDEATTTPPLWVEMKMPKQEVIEVIGRIKYLNKRLRTLPSISGSEVLNFIVILSVIC